MGNQLLAESHHLSFVERILTNKTIREFKQTHSMFGRTWSVDCDEHHLDFDDEDPPIFEEPLEDPFVARLDACSLCFVPCSITSVIC